MNAEVFIDTNIIVYAYDINSGEKQAKAIKTLDYWIKRKRAAISSQVLSEFVVVASTRLEPPLDLGELMRSIDRLTRSMIVIPITPFIILDAVRGMRDYNLSYWDSQIWAAAHLNQIPKILTEDLPYQEYIEGVQYLNPFESFLESI